MAGDVAKGAWDATRPPPPELIDDCVHCGFCLPTCPTYGLWGEEMDSPRGRIVLMGLGHEQGSSLSREMVTHFDNCLGCMACVTACPSGVRYDELITDTRAQIERVFPRTLRERALRRAIFAVFPHPRRLRMLLPFMALHRALGLRRLASRLLARRPGRLATMAAVAPPVSLRGASARVPDTLPARGVSRGRVGMLRGCVQRVFFADVNRATAEVLAAEGFDVVAPRAPRCCGALMQHSGYDEDARSLARATIEAFDGCDVVAVNSAGCGSGMKEYGHLLRDDPEWAERAAHFSAKVRDVSELLAEHEPVAPRSPVPLSVAYHDACHLAHAQGVRAQPRALLRGIPALELHEPDGWEICCGSAGIYNILKPDAAAELGKRKARALLDTGARAIAAGNPGCALQISAALEGLGHPLPVHHPIQILHASITGRPELVGATPGAA
jgi:glycolate dehydrogenase iron-sulfur subunit